MVPVLWFFLVVAPPVSDAREPVRKVAGFATHEQCNDAARWVEFAEVQARTTRDFRDPRFTPMVRASECFPEPATCAGEALQRQGAVRMP